MNRSVSGAHRYAEPFRDAPIPTPRAAEQAGAEDVEALEIELRQFVLHLAFQLKVEVAGVPIGARGRHGHHVPSARVPGRRGEGNHGVMINRAKGGLRTRGPHRRAERRDRNLRRDGTDYPGPLRYGRDMFAPAGLIAPARVAEKRVQFASPTLQEAIGEQGPDEACSPDQDDAHLKSLPAVRPGRSTRDSVRWRSGRSFRR
jgi:hypothetical protein